MSSLEMLSITWVNEKLTDMLVLVIPTTKFSKEFNHVSLQGPWFSHCLQQDFRYTETDISVLITLLSLFKICKINPVSSFYIRFRTNTSD